MLRTTLGPVSSAQLNTRTAVLRHPSARVSVPNKSSASERQSIGIVSRRVSAAAGPNARRPPPGPRTSINRSITKLRLLNRLGLSYNRIKVLPEEIQRLWNLVELDLDYNRLDTELPDGFAALQLNNRQRRVCCDAVPIDSAIELAAAAA
ncbi:uncharacterized protein KRP23_13753 [Phytophthora ramorum]|uniref:uncharacterized protein n=1 Tax=Phytophthora ramorum TaxID=164328 RepID=UPI0030AF8F95|nr:hypothetical protein KRP23_13753 [Phytophthora ramorum]